ncbi:uncharacterized protein K452DRAFT_313922 [Aplosporella prunicola CBS 121167]|uniref:Uncharacterized protein n=1 Tax=Aplosporella prunicola CBS 121167 TaxID=1176127 RepID=A0A6A6AXL1_9PEZI|nr:uncharacterized protein K452DRAFT_313922 [Aplosporella prunicola CBS 121167]KAF2135517.1 hypothetical protein K452DRAFT_313922 [Aplosporella prunicola CBS 121167]
MVKKGGSKLLNALKNEKGVDDKLENQKRMVKKAEKRKKEKKQKNEEEESGDEDVGGVALNGVAQEGKEGRKTDKAVKATKKKVVAEKKPDTEDWNTDEDEDEESDEDDEKEDEDSKQQLDLSRLADSESESDDEELEEAEEDEDIALSDLESVASEDKEDIIPHQRLTINNTAAMTAAVHRIAYNTAKMAFSEHMSITSDKPTEIADTNDDLNRELAFYQQALTAVKEAQTQLKKEGAPFTRPNDYFAEMVKSDEHMGKIKQKLIDEAASKKASAEARRQRDLKKFGKAVQVAKLQERDKAKRETMEKINLLKRKRQGADIGNENEEDMFDVALEDAAVTERADKQARRERHGGGPNAKRAKKDAKYGFGGKKRFAKSTDAQSSADMRGFSVKKMKGQTGGASKRPGKARRNAGRK